MDLYKRYMDTSHKNDTKINEYREVLKYYFSNIFDVEKSADKNTGELSIKSGMVGTISINLAEYVNLYKYYNDKMDELVGVIYNYNISNRSKIEDLFTDLRDTLASIQKIFKQENDRDI